MKLLIVNGPNLNLLGQREKSIYGESSFDEFLDRIIRQFPSIEFEYAQSNVEGELINILHKSGFGQVDGIILNAGAYTHTSVALSDAIAAIQTPVVEVHISNVYAREEYRHVSLLAKNCRGLIAGFGLESYILAVKYFEGE